MVWLLDINYVTVGVNRDHIIAAVFNRPSIMAPRWTLTLTLTNSTTVILLDDTPEKLRDRLHTGDSGLFADDRGE